MRTVRDDLAVSYPALGYHDIGFDSRWAYPPFYQYRDPQLSTWYFTRPYNSDAAVKSDIERQMFWSPWVDSEEISVAVVNGEATLTGSASSWAEHRAATSSAYQGGALQVFNNISVD